MSSGIAGIACLATGQLEAASRVASCLEHMVDAQPAPQERFYTTIEADGTLGTQFPDGEAFWRVIDAGRHDQCWYAVGLPFTFSILMHQATGERRYATLAQWFFDFRSRCVGAWDGPSSGKAAWGCSMLYRTGGDERYRDVALHVGRAFLGLQDPEGWYVRGRPGAEGEIGPRGETPAFSSSDFDGNAERVVWLSMIGSNLLARQGA
jgi:hypothetical protein